MRISERGKCLETSYNKLAQSRTKVNQNQTTFRFKQ
ncbi:unnamed protein product [Paramecium octaurelia]|uniref:Uncharacterized protein n=1 Tax=Paramecium octaurelia TaxID=43137 RepID=A0A8S1T2B8_PAROT|nr:unnamed protein product [Paramecium octaurelia]